MATMILDRQLEASLIAERQASGADRYDEVWEDIYVMAPMPNLEHQELIAGWTAALFEIVVHGQLGKVFPGVNVSDRVKDWKQNYRVPDVAVYLKSTKAVNHGTFWFGGPDFAIEILSPDDRCREKIDFYRSIDTRELLLIDRDPWQLELYRHHADQMTLVASARPDDGKFIDSQVLPLRIDLRSGDDRPRLQVQHVETTKTWMI